MPVLLNFYTLWEDPILKVYFAGIHNGFTCRGFNKLLLQSPNWIWTSKLYFLKCHLQ